MIINIFTLIISVVALAVALDNRKNIIDLRKFYNTLWRLRYHVK